jgi:hypothetical protein
MDLEKRIMGIDSVSLDNDRAGHTEQTDKAT